MQLYMYTQTTTAKYYLITGVLQTPWLERKFTLSWLPPDFFTIASSFSTCWLSLGAQRMRSCFAQYTGEKLL